MADPWGLYYCPRAEIVHGLNTTPAKVNTGLASLSDLGFAYFDVRTEWVWVVNMAAEQVLGDEKRPLKPTDNMCLAANKWYGRCPRNPWLGPFFDRYVGYLHLEERRDGGQAESLGRSKLEPAEAAEGGLVNVTSPLLLTEGEAPALAPLARALSAVEQRGAEFDKFWAAYHAKGKSSKPRTRDTWMKRKPPFEQVMAGLERWKASQRWADGYVVDAAKFLNEERWQEEPPAAPMPGASQRTQDVVEALNTGRSIFDLEGMLPEHAREPVKKLRQG
ncbi:MAG TPA: hypothetical protein VGK73_32200 [Polyangiaceae bacterium]